VHLLETLHNDVPNVTGKPLEECGVVLVRGDAQVFEERGVTVGRFL
jgi:hypothetical protein